MWKRILVPLDGSTRAERALPVAARLARATGGTVILVQVVRGTAEFELGAVPPAAWAPAADPEERLQATKYLSLVAIRSQLGDVATLMGVYAGPVVPTLLHVARSQRADVVVMSSQGRSGFSPWSLGSVAQKVAREAPVPVLVLRASSLPAGHHATEARSFRALVALDGSALAETAVAPAAQLVAALSAPEPGVLHLAGVAKAAGSVHEAQAYLRAVAQGVQESTLADLNLDVSWSVDVDEDVAKALIRRAEQGEPGADGAGDGAGRYDLIAMATHGRGGLERWAMGSVTERVLASTRLPMLIIRPSQVAAPDRPLRAQLEQLGQLGQLKQSARTPTHDEIQA